VIQTAPRHPWRPEDSRTALRGQVLVRLRPGEGPDDLPSQRLVRQNIHPAAMKLDGGPVDRAILRWSPSMRTSIVYDPARAIGSPRERAPGWDDLEQTLGLSRTYRVHLDPDAPVVAVMSALREVGVVESVSPNYLCSTPFSQGEGREEPLADPLWAWSMIGAEAARAREPGDSALIVAIVDSGVAMDHPDLRGYLRPGRDTVQVSAQRVSRGIEFFGDLEEPDDSPEDEVGHGTGCAGIVASRGGAVPDGLGGACRVLPVRVLAAARYVDREVVTAIGSIADIDEGVKAAVDLGARVLNLSFGTPAAALRDDDPLPHELAVRYALGRGCILVAASGNSGLEEQYYPACMPGVIAVGAVGADGRPTRFSTRGEHVSLCAPGVDIPTLALRGYGRQTGTSFAAPFVTAACALLAARAARLSRALTPSLARACLVGSARPFPPGTRSTGCGAGVLDLPAALAHLEQALRPADPAFRPQPAPAALGS